MPSTDQILDSAARMAAAALPLAVVWHVAMLAALVALAAGWRPTVRAACMLLAVPIASVAAASLWDSSWFNALTFAALAAALALSTRSDLGPVQISRGWPVGAGALMLAFGLAYPHFAPVESPLWYAIAAPVGVIPCPTLSAVIGFSLLLGGLDRRASLLLGGAGLFYGVVGMFVLGVEIDAALIAGAAVLLAQTVWHPRGARSPGLAV
jgi:hypothetical protein